MNTETEPGLSFEARLLSADECLERALELMHAIAPAMELSAGEIDAPSAIRLCVDGKAYGFIGESNGTLHALLIAELVDYPLKRVCNVVAYAGRARYYRQWYPKLEQWAREHGAVEMRGYGSEATCRLAEQRYGYREIYRVYAKEI